MPLISPMRLMSLVSPQPKPTEQLAETPFDDAQADLILRSSDEVPVHFCVFGNILSLASQTFADMFRIPQKPHDGVQVVPLSACSTTLDIALRHIYPVRKTPPPKADTLHYAGVLAEFARKYQVEVLDQFVIGYLTDSLEHDPVGVYAIAVAYGYNDIGQNAARSCLNLTFSDLRSPYLQYTTGEHISELFRYHVACGEAASALASSDRSWLSPLTNDLVLKTCNSCSVIDCINPISPRSDRISVPRCVWIYLHRSTLILAHHPNPEAITAEASVLETYDCGFCPRNSSMRAYMLAVNKVFGGEIKKVIERVPLPEAVSVGPDSTATATG